MSQSGLTVSYVRYIGMISDVLGNQKMEGLAMSKQISAYNVLLRVNSLLIRSMNGVHVPDSNGNVLRGEYIMYCP